MKRGEVYWADLAPRSGSEQHGRRPVVVISHDAFNQAPGWRSIIVVPLSTSVAQAGREPSAVLLSQGAAGLNKDSVALCHQVTTLDRAKLTQRIGELNSTELSQVEMASRPQWTCLSFGGGNGLIMVLTAATHRQFFAPLQG